MQNLLLLAELKVLGVCPCRIFYLAELGALGECPCRIYYFWQHWGHWACVPAEFITIGRTEGIGRVPMQTLLLLAELKA